ncbi:ACT domain-containing protein [Clostridioides difficile]|uniref:ACT domain-containing protein n=1 Tax=Clostridioides difficile TaxID=1496 RepID=UPI00255E3648|nr:ACT domain-containing protein [Clostridioides difficile]GMK84363.1 ACT domain-containing protein [Clostridioides difficile]
MKLKLLVEEYAVCRLNNDTKIPTWIDTERFYSITRTDDELSIVCLNNNIPSDVKSEKEWRILKILGPLDFSLVGILSKLSSLLADNKISIFAISTYDLSKYRKFLYRNCTYYRWNSNDYFNF